MTAAIEERPQHMDALAEANRVRLRRAALKRAVKAGEISLAELLGDEAAQSMTITEALMAQNRWGRARAAKVLSPRQITGTRRVGSLTERQRAEILVAVGERTGASVFE